jgi:hypothetical protein
MPLTAKVYWFVKVLSRRRQGGKEVLMEEENDRLFALRPRKRTKAEQPRKHELLVEVLRFVTALLAFGSVTLGVFGRFHWFSNRWVIATAGAASLTFILWLVESRLKTWAKQKNTHARDLEFIASQGSRLRKLLGQFKVFAHNTENQSLVSILRSACVDEEMLRQVYAAECVSSWFDCFYKELEFEATSLCAFLDRCAQFIVLVTEFNTRYVIPTQKQIEKGSFAVPDHFVDELEQFREDFNAFQRDIEEWANELSDHASFFRDDGGAWQRHAPVVHLERVKSFRRPKPQQSVAGR